MPQAITKDHRKRNRLSIVCTFCKKRKVKCDKGEPCRTCIRYGNTDCVYESLGIDDSLKREREYESLQNEIRILRARLEKLQDESDHFDTEPGHVEQFKSRPATKITLDNPFQDLLGQNPIAAHDDRTSFYKSEEFSIKTDKRKILRRSYLPFDWVSLARSDNTLIHVANYIVRAASVRKGAETTGGKPVSEVEEEFLSKNETIDGKADLEEYPLRTESVKSGSIFLPTLPQMTPGPTLASTTGTSPRPRICLMKQDLNKNGLYLGYLFHEADLGQVKALCTRIELVLPNKKIIWKLLDRFFAKFYPFAPIFDQQDFTEWLVEIMGPQSDSEDQPVLQIKKKTDFSLLGCLLLMLRISYLSLFSNSYKNNVEAFSSSTDLEIKYLLNHPVSLDSVTLSKECLNMFDLFTTASLSVFQLALMTRVYTFYAPEEGDGDRGTETSTFNGLLTNMAISLGLNRDPDIIFGTSMDPRAKNLNRKLWWVVYFLNMVQTLLMGSKMSIANSDFDTKYPTLDPSNSNCSNLKAEEAVVKINARKVSVHVIIDELLTHVLNVRGNSDMHAIGKSLSLLEKEVIKGYGAMCTIIKDPYAFPSEFEKMSSARYFISASVLTMSIIFNFFNYYEKKNNMKLMAFYVKKLVVMIAYDLLPFCYEIFENGKTIFKEISDLALLPELIKAIHKSTLIFVSFYVRCKNDIYRRELAKDHVTAMANDLKYAESYRVLNQTANLLKEIATILKETLVDLSPRYFYAWRINKRLGPIFFAVMGKPLYTIIGHMKGFSFDYEYVVEIHDILNTTCQNLVALKAEHKRSNSTAVATTTVSENTAPSMAPEATSQKIDDVEIDKIWKEMMAIKGDGQDDGNDSRYTRIANYADVTFDDSVGISKVDESMVGTSFGEIIEEFNMI